MGRIGVGPEVIARRAVSGGASHVEAAALAGVSQATVGSWVLQAGGMADRRVLEKKRVLSLSEREEIRVGLELNKSFAQIGRELGRHRSTISREVAANGGRGAYQAHRAQLRAEDAATRPKVSWFERCPEGWALVKRLLGLRWSPQQIAARLKLMLPDEPEMWVSHETIYRSIYVQPKATLRKELAAYLRSGRARRYPNKPKTTARRGSKIPNMVLISERPADIEDRAVPGHWEGDLIMGSNNGSQIGTIVERHSRFVLLARLESKDPAHVAKRIGEQILALPEALRRTLTWDQGTEMADHITFTSDTGIDVFFCDPHSPWQRGTNENTNGLLRQFLPKGTDLSTHTQLDLDHIADLLNGRPRETLQWMTPSEQLANALR